MVVDIRVDIRGGVGGGVDGSSYYFDVSEALIALQILFELFVEAEVVIIELLSLLELVD